MDRKNIYSVDLQKVILLPRMPGFKTAMFTRRLIVFNETFASVGGASVDIPNIPVVWHEGISGRSACNVFSAFWTFLERTRLEKVTFWMDNCSSQNKNWTVFSNFVVAVNNNELPVNNIVCKYFIPGHTFMSADSVHHNIEQGMRKHKDLYDFMDFCSVVSAAGKNDTIAMHCDNFRNWQDGSSQAKLKKAERPMLNEICYAEFRRGSRKVLYRKVCDGELQEFDFLKNKFPVGILPESQNRNRGVNPTKKQDIIRKLLPLMPQNRHCFWNGLDDNEMSADLLHQI